MLPSAFRPIIPCILLNASPITTYASICPLAFIRLLLVFVAFDSPAALNVMASLPVARELALARPPPNE